VKELALPAALIVSVIALVLCAARSRRRESRLRSLARPLHEVRGAMTALELGLTALARRVPLELADRVEALRAQLERLMVAAEDLEAQRDGTTLPPNVGRGDAVELGAVVRRSVLAWTATARDRGARLELRWFAGEVWIGAQSGRIRQALDNLISNAIEHGGGRVLVKGERRPGRVRVTVTDGGPGLATQPEQLVEAPWRAARGHGLAIARDVVRSHGGRLATRMTSDGPGLALELPTKSAPTQAVAPARRGTEEEASTLGAAGSVAAGRGRLA
jgi:signal transduction histidine kinase